ncbi:hypothetical protein KFL_002140130 [Klebsormidium nitens]|uniref:Uncharacterized protein n=1 Tax=Klebsormidium nitens TaxID=105231 RepID=A0A1Y1I6B6_KLENI|nr:hypothetical protein KFL_002140130 [Klebsormidium nitens]|eukprot:GAQ84959.1 hypothetical protein KFL_002140130 [Klebsormidium nitens]
MYSNDVASESGEAEPECQETEPLKFQEKHAANQNLISVQAGIIHGLHAHMLKEQRAFEDTQVAWSRQQDQELAVLNKMLLHVRGLSAGSDATTAQDCCAEEATCIQQVESALRDAKIEALEAEQERALWEERARRAMDEAAAIVREDRLVSASRTEHLEGLLSTAEARMNELEEECCCQAQRADRAEARVGQLEDEMRAAKAIWVDLQQRERDWEETAAFLKAQLAVAQSQVKVSKLRLSQQQPGSLVAPPPTEIAIGASPSIGYVLKRNEVDGKENDWQALTRSRVAPSGTLLGFETEKQVYKKKSVRVAPAGSLFVGNARTESRNSLKPRKPLKLINNR